MSSDFLSADQVTFALQSGPALIRQGDDQILGPKKSGDTPYNMPDSGMKSLSGIDASGNFVVVDVSGDIGPYCLAKYLKRKKGITDLLTRDAYRIGGSSLISSDPSGKQKIDTWNSKTPQGKDSTTSYVMSVE